MSVCVCVYVTEAIDCDANYRRSNWMSNKNICTPESQINGRYNSALNKAYRGLFTTKDER